jgi:ribonuclease BN (tRNA processing enzyme)
MYMYISWSKAGVGTTIHVQGLGKQANMLFDCGHLDEAEFSAKHVFISHGHVDHIGSCIIHARGKALSGKPATYYVPPHCVEPLRDAQR